MVDLKDLKLERAACRKPYNYIPLLIKSIFFSLFTLYSSGNSWSSLWNNKWPAVGQIYTAGEIYGHTFYFWKLQLLLPKRKQTATQGNMCHVLLARNKAQSPALYLKQALLVVYRLHVVRQHLSVQWSQLTQRYIRKLSVFPSLLLLKRPCSCSAHLCTQSKTSTA